MGAWRTLTSAEWQYLFSLGSYTSEVRKDKYKCDVTVCGKANCVVLLPDNWQWDASTVGTDWQKDANAEIEYNEETTIKWSTMQAAGAVCLPAAGGRDGSNVVYVGTSGGYWSSTADGGATGAFRVRVTGSIGGLSNGDNRKSGWSVRLVTEGVAAGDSGNGTEQYTNNDNPGWFNK